jgi:hypothetical protein
MIFMRIILALLLILLTTGTASGRVSTLDGSISLIQEYDSNIGLAAEDEQDGWFTSISPSLLFTSRTESDQLSFGYAPGLRLDHESDRKRVEHYLTLEGDKRFSPRWSGRFRENFIRSNDYTYFVLEHVQEEGAGIPLFRGRERRQYWANSISLATDYEYARDSVLGLGYSNRILENDAPGLDDYVRHQPFATIGYRFDRNWEARLSYDYIRGDFDVTEDFDQHIVGTVINHYASQHEMYFGSYQFTNSSYEDLEIEPGAAVEPKNDYKLHRADLGWQRALDPHSAIVASIGLSHADREIGDSETGFNYSADFTREVKNGQLSIGGKGGMDELQFAAAGRDGLSRFWSIRGAVDYRLQQHLSSHGYLSYREDNYFETLPDFEERSYVGGLRLSYAFWRWYALTVGYSYRHLDSERPAGDYRNHRAYVELSTGKELARWW